MLVTLTTTHPPATDLGFLLHENPARARQVEVSTGTAHVFHPATGGRPAAGTVARRRGRWCRRRGLVDADTLTILTRARRGSPCSAATTPTCSR